VRSSSLLKDCSDGMGIHLSPEQLKKFEIYLEQLKIWNHSVNLTSITNDEEIVIKHFIDSIAGLIPEQIPDGARLLDVGTGAGFPGIPLKIARPDLQITLVEPVQKKVSFLYSLVGMLRIKDVTIFYGSCEEFREGLASEQAFDRITTRALKSEVLLGVGDEFLADEGRAIMYLSQPLTQCLVGWSLEKQYSYDLPHGTGRRTISILSKAGK